MQLNKSYTNERTASQANYMYVVAFYPSSGSLPVWFTSVVSCSICLDASRLDEVRLTGKLSILEK